MSICDSEENRKKLAWLVPGYILLAWFFCVLFQPLGIRSPNSRYHPRLTKYGEQIIYLTSDDVNTQYCRNNGSVITLEMGQRSAVVIRLGRIQHHMEPFLCSLRIKKGNRQVIYFICNLIVQFICIYLVRDIKQPIHQSHLITTYDYQTRIQGSRCFCN